MPNIGFFWRTGANREEQQMTVVWLTWLSFTFSNAKQQPPGWGHYFTSYYVTQSAFVQRRLFAVQWTGSSFDDESCTFVISLSNWRASASSSYTIGPVGRPVRRSRSSENSSHPRMSTEWKHTCGPASSTQTIKERERAGCLLFTTYFIIIKFMELNF